MTPLQHCGGREGEEEEERREEKREERRGGEEGREGRKRRKQVKESDGLTTGLSSPSLMHSQDERVNSHLPSPGSMPTCSIQLGMSERGRDLLTHLLWFLRMLKASS